MLVYHVGIEVGLFDLSKEAVSHLRARRAKVGDHLRLCDGMGQVFNAKVLEMGRNQVTCQVSEPESHEKPSYPRLVLGVPKFATLEFVLQKAVEIGVSEIILLKSEFTPVPFDEKIFEKKRSRWEKIVISACEQSEMFYQPKLTWMSFGDYIKTDQPKCLFHPYGESREVPKGADLMVGPEGGWSDAELSYNIPKVTLNTGILRVDTACIAALLSVAMR